MFDFSWKFCLNWEGGFTDDKDDPGGVTNWGVDRRMLESMAKNPSDRERLHEIGVRLPICRQSIVDLTPAQAKQIYRYEVWDKLGLNRFALPVACVLFDAGVNMGQKRSTKIIQMAHNVLHPSFRLVEDGILGPKTRQAIITDQPMPLAKKALDKREQWYNDRVKVNPKQKKFLAGWLNRVNGLRKYLGVK